MLPGYNWRPRQWERIDRRKAWNRRLVVVADSAAAAVPGRSVVARPAPYQQSIYRSNRGTEFWIADEGSGTGKEQQESNWDGTGEIWDAGWMTGTAAADEQGVLHTDRRQETHTGMERCLSSLLTLHPSLLVASPRTPVTLLLSSAGHAHRLSTTTAFSFYVRLNTKL